MHNSNLKKILNWLDDHILLLLSGFLLAFIPLYPKIPLYSPIEAYIVRVRLEDLFVFLTAIIWLVQAWRGKIKWRAPVFWMVMLYFIAGALTMLASMFVIKTIPLELLHIGKSALHYFRYLEYFSLLFITFSAIKDRKQLKILIGILVATLVGVVVYGYGQKFYYWPVYSTMNREFSKGVRLVLTEHARVQSTFAGHYDLGGYLVIILPFVLALALGVKNKLAKVSLHLAHLLGLWLLVVSASRTSFGAYLIGITLVVVLMALKQSGWGKKIWWAFSREVLMVIVVSVMMLYFGDDMYERFLQVIDLVPQVAETYHNINDKRKILFNGNIEKFFFGDEGYPDWLANTMPKAERPENSLTVEEATVLVSSDQRPVPYRPSDVYEDIPDLVEVATISAQGKEETIFVEKPRTFSDNSLKYGLSLGIRLDALWPMAIEGFKTNPLTGKGYATLGKEGLYSFTEADSTDNNFLRTLGETGLLGFISFYGVVVLALYFAIKGYKDEDFLLQLISIGFIASSIGLLINATYIDVYAASKVAFSYWGLTGLYLASVSVIDPSLLKVGWIDKLNEKSDLMIKNLQRKFKKSKVTYKTIQKPKNRKKVLRHLR